ncbi:MAG: hypothetical protein A2X79_03340 [Desulfuromonadaceae bacterium GWB2_53_15]|nr:MAG: hypothetical protein A2X79_03340 [Desulfuromonadaceae bacterium GWB2_53_15]
MKLVIDHIQEKPFPLRIEESAGLFPVLSRMQSEGECTFTGPILCDITAAREYDHLRVSGRVDTQVTLACSRCTAIYEAGIGSTFTIIYRKGNFQEVDQEEETELSDQDLISATYIGNEIDLTHEIEEQVAMEIPIKPLCNEACKGLCPVCGIDLNHATCSCSSEQTSFKFSALKDFKVSR